MNSNLKQRLKIVLFVVLFSMAGEYSLRGFGHFLEVPELAVLIFLNYLPYFLLLEDFIGRYNLRPYQLYFVSVAFGIYWQIIGAPVLAYPNLPPLPEYVFGFNVYGLFYNDFIVWPLLQSVFAFYLANRIFHRPERKPLLSSWAIAGCVVFFSIITFSFRVFVPDLPMLTIYQFTVAGLLVAAFFGLFVWSIMTEKRLLSKKDGGGKDSVLDWVGVIVGVVMVYLIFFIPYRGVVQGATPVNKNSVLIFLLYTAFLGIAYVFRCGILKRKVSV
jgi:hypothetical protein